MRTPDLKCDNEIWAYGVRLLCGGSDIRRRRLENSLGKCQVELITMTLLGEMLFGIAAIMNDNLEGKYYGNVAFW